MNLRLKPCPFCGDSEELQIMDCEDDQGKSYIWCYNCEASGPSAIMPEDLWNYRPVEDSLNSENGELRTRLEKLGDKNETDNKEAPTKKRS